MVGNKILRSLGGLSGAVDAEGPQQKIRCEQVRLLYAGLTSSVPATLLIALMLVAVQWEVVSHPVMVGWFSAIVLVSLWRFGSAVAYRRSAPAAGRIGLWYTRFLVGTLAAGAIWGLGAWLMFPAESIPHQAFPAVVLTGLTAGAVASLSASFPVLLAFVLLSLPPIVIRCLFGDSYVIVSLGGLMIIFLGFVVITARQYSASIVQNLLMRLESGTREQVLAESEERYRNLFELSEDPMWVIDGDRFVLANEAASRMLGYGSPAELDGFHPWDLSPPLQEDGQPSHDKANDMMLAAHQNGYHRFEWLHKKKNHEIFPVEVTLTRIPFKGIPALFCVWRDISERKNTEQALIEARRNAVQANRAKSEFLVSMSHELRTPLNAILGFTQLLERSRRNPLVEKQREQLGRISEAGNHLLELITEVLDLAKIEAGRLKLSLERIEVGRLVKDCAALAETLAANAGIGIELTCAPANCEQAMIRVDHLRTRQALLNLFSNAIKYNRPGGRVTIDYRQVTDGYVRVAVSDEGPGIPEQYRVDLFKPFSRLGAEGSQVDGTGIGLVLTKQIVENMRGRIGFENREDRGSTFWIELPLAEAGRPETSVGRNRESDELKVTDEVNQMIFLVDTAANRYVM